MKIYLSDENKRKIVYDILNIFYDDRQISFDHEGEIKILDDKIILQGQTYPYKDNYELKATLYKLLVHNYPYKDKFGLVK